MTQENILARLRSVEAGVRERTLKELYRDHYSVIADFVMKNSGNETDAADIFQDAIVVLYEKVRKEDLVLNCTVRTYLYSVARNLWFNRIRKLQRESVLNEEMNFIPIDPEVLQVLDNQEQEKLVVSLLEKLGESCREVIRYYYYEQLKMKEIAAKMGFANDQIAKNKKSTCLKKLREMVSGMPGLTSFFKS